MHVVFKLFSGGRTCEEDNYEDARSQTHVLPQAAVLLMTWSTSSSNVMYPWTFGVLGVIGGPLLMLAAFAIN